MRHINLPLPVHRMPEELQSPSCSQQGRVVLSHRCSHIEIVKRSDTSLSGPLRIAELQKVPGIGIVRYDIGRRYVLQPGGEFLKVGSETMADDSVLDTARKSV